MCLLRHINDKPTWQAEDVWLFDKSFDLNKVDDQEHCLTHKLIAGGIESLKQYRAYGRSGRDVAAHAAVAYLDVPALLSVDMMDLPGYGHDIGDNERAEMGRKLVDVVIYTSTTASFMDQSDLDFFSTILRQLPILGSYASQINPLRNVYVVATHAQAVSPASQREEVLDLAAARVTKHLEPMLNERGNRAEVRIEQARLRACFFTFSADDASIRANLISDFTELLSSVLPARTLTQLDLHVRQAKVETTASCDRWIARLQTALTARDRAQAEVFAIEEGEPVRIRKRTVHEKNICDIVDNFCTESTAFVAPLYSERVNVSAIESMIRNRYDNKKEAQQFSTSHLLNSIQKPLDEALMVKSKALGQEIEAFLQAFGPAVDASIVKGGDFDFNARVAFMNAMAGAITIGALAAWVSIAAAGSHFGGHIVAEQVVGWLSSMGLSVGSSASVISAVAAVGGPITLGIATGVSAALLVASLFGDSWQTKRAQKIRDGFAERAAQAKMTDGSAKYWSATRHAFIAAAAVTEATYQERLQRLRVLAFSTERESIEAELAFAKETRDFFCRFALEGAELNLVTVP